MRQLSRRILSLFCASILAVCPAGFAASEDCGPAVMVAPGAMDTLCPSDPTATIQAEVANFKIPSIYPDKFFDELNVAGFKTQMTLDQVEDLLKQAGYTKFATSGKTRGAHVFCRGRKLLFKVEAFHPNGDKADFLFTPPDFFGHQRVFELEFQTLNHQHSLKSLWQHMVTTHGPPTLPFIGSDWFDLSYWNDHRAKGETFDTHGRAYTVALGPDRQTGNFVYRARLIDRVSLTAAEQASARNGKLVQRLRQIPGLYPDCP